MTAKRTVLVCGALAVALLVIANTRTWASGSVSDAVLRHSQTTATGGGAAPAAVVATLVVVHDPAAALGSSATTMTGHTGDRHVVADLSAWPWVALLGGVLLTMTGALAVLGARSWSGLSSRYDAPGDRPTRRRSDWDLLSDGQDPTDPAEGSDTIEQRRGE